jgi:hypothetical protein
LSVLPLEQLVLVKWIKLLNLLIVEAALARSTIKLVISINTTTYNLASKYNLLVTIKYFASI